MTKRAKIPTIFLIIRIIGQISFNFERSIEEQGVCEDRALTPPSRRWGRFMSIRENASTSGFLQHPGYARSRSRTASEHRHGATSRPAPSARYLLQAINEPVGHREQQIARGTGIDHAYKAVLCDACEVFGI